MSNLCELRYTNGISNIEIGDVIIVFKGNIYHISSTNTDQQVDYMINLLTELCKLLPGMKDRIFDENGNLRDIFVKDNYANLIDAVWNFVDTPRILFGEVVEVASSAESNYTYIPKNFDIPADADYLHITSNNTIFGTEMRYDLDSPVPLVADMSSDIFSRPVDVSKYNCIYAGAQKNVSMAGVNILIVKDDALGKVSRQIPTMLDYRTHVQSGSMFNTPPVVPIYCAMKNLEWVKNQGGVKAMDKRAHERADLLYSEIERNKLFRGTVKEEDRSLMNICFVMNDEYKELEADFLQYATDRGMVGIKGHRSVGGFRASCYNAQTIEGVQALIQCMKDFEAQH